jgi:hypothetical protein
MILHAKKRSLPATIVCNPEIMGGVPTIRGTRIPVEMILIHLRAGYSRVDIFSDYPAAGWDRGGGCVGRADDRTPLAGAAASGVTWIRF